MAGDLSEFTTEDELRNLVTKLQRQLVTAKSKTSLMVTAVYDAAREAAVAAGPRRPIPSPSVGRRTRGAEAALVHLSDWQVGKRTSSYNTDVARERLVQLAKKVRLLTDIQRHDHPVPECHVMLGGDMVEGVTVFPGQVWEVDSTLFTQLFATTTFVEDFLTSMLAFFPKVVVWDEYGNHGRIGKRGDVAGTDNVDLMVYRIVRDKMKGEPRLEWHTNETSWYNMVRIGAYNALLVHGDEVKSFGGQTPAFGITRKVNAWATGVIEPFTDCYMGHWHSPLVLPIAHGRGRTFVNPTLESDSTYAQEFVGATNTPGQRLNFVDPDRGRVTGEYPIWLE